MRDVCFSQLEHDFVLRALRDKQRCDERDIQDLRDLQISFGLDYGCCTVSLGDTKVLAQVAAEIERPKESRPSEGSLSVHVELSTIASANFDPTKPGDLGIEIQRVLERSIVFSHAVDLEELCVRVGERAWALQLHLHVLCHDGNILDCACIAAITALKHFRRPHVSVQGQEVTVHTIEEKNPVPLTVHHMPFCATFAFFKDCETFIFDPSGREEKVMDGKLIISMNKHREVCCLQTSGPLQFTSEQIIHCTSVAFDKVKSLTEFVIRALDEDQTKKKQGATSSVALLKAERLKKPVTDLTSHSRPVSNVPAATPRPQVPSNVELPEEETAPSWLTKHNDQTASIGGGEVNSWAEPGNAAMSVFKALRKEDDDENDDDNDDDDDDDAINDSDEETMTLEQTDVGMFGT